MGFETIQELKKLDVFTLNKEFGRKSGTYIYNSVRGIDNESVKQRDEKIQYSKIMTLRKDSTDYQFLLENILELCKEVFKVVKKITKCSNQLEYILFNQT